MLLRTKVDDTDSSINYSSGWSTWSGNPGYQSTEHYSEVTGSIATFNFNGVGARYYGFKRNDLGYAEIYLDDVLKSTIDCYNASSQFDVLLYETTGLTQ